MADAAGADDAAGDAAGSMVGATDADATGPPAALVQAAAARAMMIAKAGSRRALRGSDRGNIGPGSVNERTVAAPRGLAPLRPCHLLRRRATDGFTDRQQIARSSSATAGTAAVGVRGQPVYTPWVVAM